MFYSLSKDQAAVIRQKLLETLGSEPERVVRNKISDAVAEVARQYTENSQSTTSTPTSLMATTNHIVSRGYLARTPWRSLPTEPGS